MVGHRKTTIMPHHPRHQVRAACKHPLTMCTWLASATPSSQQLLSEADAHWASARSAPRHTVTLWRHCEIQPHPRDDA